MIPKKQNTPEIKYKIMVALEQKFLVLPTDDAYVLDLD